MEKLAAIVGPTAAGKTHVAIEVAKKLNAEIISCDSMQVYRGMNIGTAKAKQEERSLVPHHLIDMVEPDEEYNVARYQSHCQQLIHELNLQGILPLLVGGTGLYYQAVVDDYAFIPLASRLAVREKWNNLIGDKGLPFAYSHLQSIDPAYAEKIAPQDQKRIVRALEVYELSGETFSSTQKKSLDHYKLAVVGLYMPRPQLYARIEARVEAMLVAGLVDEVITLRANGFDLSLNSMQALGYRQVMYYLDGLISHDEMVNDIKRETRRYAKRQFTWFNRDKRIKWLNTSDYSDEAELTKKILGLIEGQFPIV